MDSTTSFAPDIPYIPVNEYKSYDDLDKAVKYASENCSSETETTGGITKAQEESMKATMDMLNIGQCEYSQAGFRGEVNLRAPLVSAAASVSGSAQSSSGCEQINIVSNIMSQCTKQLNCMLNQVRNTSTTNVNTFQEIYTELGDISGSDITLSNKSESNIKTVDITQSQVQSAIGATIKQGLDTAIQQATDFTSESMSDPSSQKSMQQLLSNIQSVASNTTINQSVTETTKNMSVNQKIKLIARNVTNSKLTLSNENILTLMSENYVYNALDQLFKTESVQTALTEVVQTTTAKKEGALGKLSNPTFSTTEIIAFAIVGIIIAIVGGYLAYRYLKK